VLDSRLAIRQSERVPTPDADRLIYVEGWQMECCGDAFATGSVVRWTLAPADHDFLDAVLGPALSADVTDAEEHHHDPATTSVQPFSGVVRSIRTVSCQYAKPEGASSLYPVANTAVLTEVTSTEATIPAESGVVFLGWLVSVAPAASGA
jgi:hypothetical protein